jgi:hypothetical protein
MALDGVEFIVIHIGCFYLPNVVRLGESGTCPRKIFLPVGSSLLGDMLQGLLNWQGVLFLEVAVGIDMGNVGVPSVVCHQTIAFFRSVSSG